MLEQDYMQQRGELNRNTSENRRRTERRTAERRTALRRANTRRRQQPSGEAIPVEVERRIDERRKISRREGERRAADRRLGERRRSSSGLRRFPGPEGFLTSEEREFLLDLESNDD
ncbi:MAG: hypothetical protein AAF640_06635 [Pseudomonadota bacterium]